MKTGHRTEKKPLPYPKPGKVGGKLIRETISNLRQALTQSGSPSELPLTSHILIALSGGSDSIALATLLKKYGRRVGDPSKIQTIHINHGWRGKASNTDEKFVRAFCKKNDIKLQVVRLKDKPKAGESWEDAARRARKTLYKEWSEKTGGYVLTAHHADDLAETVLWRLLSGESESHGAGIYLAHGRELRPFLTIRKSELQAFLKEEKQTWREDKTNREGRFLRSRFRTEVFPVLENLFPKAVVHLAQLGMQAQKAKSNGPHSTDSKDLFVGLAAQLGLSKRAHFDALQKLALKASKAGKGEWQLHLGEGWKLSVTRTRIKAAPGAAIEETWQLRRHKPLE